MNTKEEHDAPTLADISGDTEIDELRARIVELEAENARLRNALVPIVKLMLSMQRLGYFTNDEWLSRLLAAKEALGYLPAELPQNYHNTVPGVKGEGVITDAGVRINWSPENGE